MNLVEPQGSLPSGRTAAVCFTIDDIHPGKSSDRYEAGGDLGQGALRHVEWLLSRHDVLKVTLFVTPDWRETSPVPTRRALNAIPYLRDRVHLAPRLPPSTMRLDRRPAFVEYLRSLPRTDVALHGLHHVHPGRRIPVEFQAQSEELCRRMLMESMAIFKAADLPFSPGMTPPGFDAPPALLSAMADVGLQFIASGRDIGSAITADAVVRMSGLVGTSLLFPQRVADGRMVHIPTNFQASSTIDRAFEILDLGGLLSVKAHIVKNAMGYIALDGLDSLYANYLDVLFTRLEDRYGSNLWWTSPAEMSSRIMETENHAGS